MPIIATHTRVINLKSEPFIDIFDLIDWDCVMIKKKLSAK